MVDGHRVGRWQTWRALGQPLEDATYVAGKRDGPWVKYYGNCQVEERGGYRDGQEDGPWKYFSQLGKPTREGQWRAGRMVGQWTLYDGETGQRTLEGPYVDGRAEGTFTEYLPTGAKWRDVPFVKGRRGGAEEAACDARKGTYTVDYQKLKESCLVRGVEEGVAREYDAQGRLKSKAEMRAGRRDGWLEEFHPSGELLHRGKYVLSIPDGTHTFVAADGKVYGTSIIARGTGAWVSYFSGGGVHERGAFALGCQDGHWETFDSDGRLALEDNFSHCRREGKVIQYFSTGQKATEGQFRDGAPDGTWRGYFNNGDPQWEGNYLGGKRAGQWKVFRWGRSLESEGEMRENSPTGPWTFYYPTGEVKERGALFKGERDGKWKQFFSDGTPWREVVFSGGVEGLEQRKCSAGYGDWVGDGEARSLGCLVCRVTDGGEVTRVGVGPWMYWHPSGEKEKEGTLADGKPDGAWRYYFDNGAVMMQGNFKFGQEEGPWTGTYRDGGVRFQGRYSVGKPQGEWKSYAPDGTIASDGTYDGGVKVGHWKYADDRR